MNAFDDSTSPLDQVAENTLNSLTARVTADPETVERGLVQLVLTLVELLRQLMERQPQAGFGEWTPTAVWPGSAACSLRMLSVSGARRRTREPDGPSLRFHGCASAGSTTVMRSAAQEPGHTSASAAPWRIRRQKPMGRSGA